MKRRARWQIKNNDLDSIDSQTSNLEDYDIGKKSSLQRLKKAKLNINDIMTRISSGNELERQSKKTYSPSRMSKKTLRVNSNLNSPVNSNHIVS